MAECPRCLAPVERKGYTCNVKCYADWFHAFAASGRLHLDDGDEPPLDIEYQPWYNRMVRLF